LCEDAGDSQWEGEPGNEPLDGGRITSMTALDYEIRVEGVVPSEVLDAHGKPALDIRITPRDHQPTAPHQQGRND